jgi:hypothetical protein
MSLFVAPTQEEIRAGVPYFDVEAAVTGKSRETLQQERDIATLTPDEHRIWIGSDPTVVRVTSHRAREKLDRLIGRTQAYYQWDKNGEWRAVPPESLDECLAITGIKRAKWSSDMRQCINWG